MKGLPHSKQHAFNRDVINPQDGHILCDPNPAIRGFSPRILSNKIVNSTITRLKQILVALMKAFLLGDFRIECYAADGDGAFDFTAFHILIAIQPPEVFS